MVKRILESEGPLFFAFIGNDCIIVMMNMNGNKRHIILDQEKSKEFINAIHQK